MLPTTDFWDGERKRLAAVVTPRLEYMAMSGAQSATQHIGVGFDYSLYNDLASQWAADYTDTLLQQLGTTSENIVGDILSGWIQDGGTIGDLQSLLTPAFGVDRAFTIAVTETTRAFASGQFLAFSREGVQRWRWNTNHDELVCPYCGDVDGKVVTIGEPFGEFGDEDVEQPPYHVNCRCWVSPVVLQMLRKLAPTLYGQLVHRAVALSMTGQIFIYLQKGGEGSGDFSHEGRPGEVGGSGEGGGVSKRFPKLRVVKGDANSILGSNGGLIAVAIQGDNKGTVLFNDSTDINVSHSQMIAAYDSKDTVDNYVRYVYAGEKENGIETDTQYAAAVNNRTKAMDNIFKANDILIAKGMSSNTGVVVHQSGGRDIGIFLKVSLAKSAVDSKALQIAHDAKEHIAVITPAGKVLYENVGNTHHVDIPASVPLKGNIILHNHPAGTSFSSEDVRHGIASGAASIRVVTPQGTEYGMDFSPDARGNNTMAQLAAKSRPDPQNKEWDNVWQQFSMKNPAAKYKARRLK